MRLPRPDKTPYCTAPFTSAVVDPDKGVRPCCVFGERLGHLQTQRLADILSGPAWKEVQRAVAADELPPGCVKCYEREKATGWSVRHSFLEARATATGQWRDGLTELELNTTNVCNLACTHCSIDFSSRWGHLVEQLTERGVPHHRRIHNEIYKPDPAGMVEHLSALDLSALDQIRFKGGEPMLSPDVPAVLRYLKERGLLSRLRIFMVTNGSTVDEDVLALMGEAAAVEISISVDGTGKVQEYIRHGPSSIPRIETFIRAFSALPRIELDLCVSIMAYNVFSLDRITDWWNGQRETYGRKLKSPLRFHLEVIEPAILNVNVLQDATRKALVRKYRALGDADYASVIHALRQPFAGVALHNDFVAYTRGMDDLRRESVLDAIPELAPELTVLTPPPPSWRVALGTRVASASKAWRAGLAAGTARWKGRLAAPETAEGALRKGVSWARAGRREDAVRLYDRFLSNHPEANPGTSWALRLHHAVVLAQLERWERSLAAFDGLIRLDPKLALTALAPKDEGGRDVFPAEWDVGGLRTPSFRLLVEGLAHRALHDHRAAVARWDQALELDPGFMLARVARDGASDAAPA